MGSAYCTTEAVFIYVAVDPKSKPLPRPADKSHFELDPQA
ncbi:putative acyl-CoA thioester hydrolase [Candidatus Erwinia dacicola]|uniref:Putative acyl-CoA thioester hydrolase n=1 Tax=Candidatus Erwinia dacicola TaxID=252393 RepID=A0A2T6MMM5_9GAMM|nr:putative acyl-CoA thioester hydrolase [Candidatus Erwinia dacicola]RAP70960.1 putative acyl-CoA thioester hydrolase [Candidatus Erwinia dacicola]